VAAAGELQPLFQPFGLEGQASRELPVDRRGTVGEIGKSGEVQSGVIGRYRHEPVAELLEGLNLGCVK
jgi:hypothetical protein